MTRRAIPIVVALLGASCGETPDAVIRVTNGAGVTLLACRNGCDARTCSPPAILRGTTELASFLPMEQRNRLYLSLSGCGADESWGIDLDLGSGARPVELSLSLGCVDKLPFATCAPTGICKSVDPCP